MNATYVFNPDYVLKNDLDKILLYSQREAVGEVPLWASFIHPVQAMILSFFTHDRTFEQNLGEIADFLDKDTDSVRTLLSQFIENEEPLKCQWNGSTIRFPRQVLINKEKVRQGTNPFRNLSVEEFICKFPMDTKERRVNTMPLRFTFMLTNKCVTRCKYCYADTQTRTGRQLPTERILALIREASEIGLQDINLIGGEIFLHKDWDIILAELKKHQFEPNLISTKYPQTEEMIGRLEEIGVTSTIQISMDAADSRILRDSLEVGENYLDNIKNCVALLDGSKLRYHVSTVLTKYNIGEQALTQMFDFLKTLKRIEYWELRVAMNSIYKSEFEKIKLRKDEIDRAYDFIKKKIIPATDMKITLDESTPNKSYYTAEQGSESFDGAQCSALNSHMFILPDGQVTICEQLYWNPRFIIGDVTNQSISEVWSSPRALELVHLKRESIQKGSRCRTCGIFENCFNKAKNRCWADIIKAYGDENWDFPDPRCNKAPSMTFNLGFQ